MSETRTIAGKVFAFPSMEEFEKMPEDMQQAAIREAEKAMVAETSTQFKRMKPDQERVTIMYLGAVLIDWEDAEKVSNEIEKILKPYTGKSQAETTFLNLCFGTAKVPTHEALKHLGESSNMFYSMFWKTKEARENPTQDQVLQMLQDIFG